MNASEDGLRRLNARLTRLFAARDARTVSRFRPLLYIGLETRHPGELYEWRGQRRRDTVEGGGGQPRALFQYTLEGWGEYRARQGRPMRVEPGAAFTAILPSAHVYRLPRDSPGWRFFWIVIHHPYVVERLAAGGASPRASAVFPVPADSPLAARAAALWASVCRATPADEWMQEAFLLNFLLAHERHGRALAHPAEPREILLTEARELAAATAGLPPRVEDLAQRHGMSRSHFSHHFRAVTGQTPAAVLLAARLERAAAQLTSSAAKLATVARSTGFVDATGLCRAFRRYYHMSPDQFRRQAQGE